VRHYDGRSQNAGARGTRPGQHEPVWLSKAALAITRVESLCGVRSQLAQFALRLLSWCLKRLALDHLLGHSCAREMQVGASTYWYSSLSHIPRGYSYVANPMQLPLSSASHTSSICAVSPRTPPRGPYVRRTDTPHNTNLHRTPNTYTRRRHCKYRTKCQPH